MITALMISVIPLLLLFPDTAKASMPNALIFPVLFLVVLPISVYIRSKRSFKNNHRLCEQIEYVFGDQNLTITGESFNATMTWDKIFKGTKTKRWMLIWQAGDLTSIIPLRSISESDIQTLKEILQKHGVKNNL
ncbi:YcxB family protein [Niabella hirudinis]|uniref:YcxB family protein n=1 Tax=Niabella hirudinis TaxID=1285929 RepID=UPI003EBEA69F